MDPLAVLAEMDAIDAAGVRVEEIPNSDAQLQRPQAAPTLTVYPQTKKNVWTNLFLVTGFRVTTCWVTRPSQRQMASAMSQPMAPFADMEMEQQGYMDKEDVLVALLLDKEKETGQGVEGVVAEQADDDGTGRMSATTQHLGTATEMTLDWMDSSSSLQIKPGLCPPSWRFPSQVWEWFCQQFFSRDVDTKVQYTNNKLLVCSCQQYNQSCQCDQRMKCTASLLCCSYKHISIYFCQGKKAQERNIVCCWNTNFVQQKFVFCCCVSEVHLRTFERHAFTK